MQREQRRAAKWKLRSRKTRNAVWLQRRRNLSSTHWLQVWLCEFTAHSEMLCRKAQRRFEHTTRVLCS